MKPAFPFLLLVLLCFSSCKEDPYSPKGLSKMTEDQMYEMFIEQKNFPGGNVVYKDEFGNEISLDSIKKIPNASEDYTIDIYLNEDNEIVEMVFRPATEKDKAFKTRLREANPKPKEVISVAIDCSRQKEILEEVLAIDQEIRNGGNPDPDKDVQNLSKVISLIEQCGMPTAAEVGPQQMMAIWLVFQHADQKYRKAYFPLLKEAAENGDLQLTQIAMMQDRILMDEGKPQLYGTQVKTNSATEDFELYDLENPESVDQRRAEVGFGPLKEYLQRWDIDFNVEQVE